MATVGGNFLTLYDQIKRRDPNGGIANIVEQMTLMNPILEDAPAIEGNLTTGHQVSIRKGLPAVGYRRFNEGVTSSKSTVEQVQESCGMLTGLSKVDCRLAALGGNDAEFRASEDKSFMIAMNNQIGNDIFYSSVKSAPEQFHGFTPRYDSTTYENARNIVKCISGASGSDQGSLWIIGWSPETCFLTYPKGTKAGIDMVPVGKQLVRDAGGTKEYLAWVTEWTWQIGLVIKDWRYVVRICNIDVSALTASSTSEIIDSLVVGYNKMQGLNNVRPVIYGGRDILTYLDLQALKKSNHFLNTGEWFGKPVTMFRNIPIRMCESLSITEALVA